MSSVVWYLKFAVIVQIMWTVCDASTVGDSISKHITEDIANSLMGVKEFQVIKILIITIYTAFNYFSF